LRMLEVVVVAVVLLMILIFGVVMVQKILQNVTQTAMFKQTYNLYGNLYYIELQSQGLAKEPDFAKNIPTRKVLGYYVPNDLMFFGSIISSPPSSKPKYNGITVNTVFYQFEEYKPHTINSVNPNWLQLTNLAEKTAIDMTSEVFGDGTIPTLLSGDSYEVTIFPVFDKKTFSGTNWSAFSNIFGMGHLTITSDYKQYIDASISRWKGYAFVWPKDGYVEDSGFGAVTMTVYSFLRSPFPFNTMNTKAQVLIEFSPICPILITSEMNIYSQIDKFISATNGSTEKASTVNIDGKDYSILTDGMSVFVINSTIDASLDVKAYYGKVKIQEPETVSGYPLVQNVTIISVTPPLYPGSSHVEPLTLLMKPVAIKILDHKKYYILTVKDGKEYEIYKVEIKEEK